jgi:NADH dehydrogenase (ubiquinone) 1 alpha subcomplex subunit 6
MLLIKGEEELSNVVEHAKQRHHIIGQYVVNRNGPVHGAGTINEPSTSQFLKNFYTTNYF